MSICDVQNMLTNYCDDPYFFVDYYNVGRGSIKTGNCDKPYINRTIEINCWMIKGDELQKENEVGILFDTETYLVQWKLALVVDHTTTETSLFYYWKGDNASKGFSPLPTEIKNQNPIVERICQWSEPALFFHIFPRSLIVFNCKRSNFNPESKRLFMVRGELEDEIHLYEVPFQKNSLRSRTIFILIEPNKQTVYYWYGASITGDFHRLVEQKLNLSEYQESWKHLKKIDVYEGQDEIFLEELGSEGDSYVSIKDSSSFTPRLFYFNSITGDFLATEVEYPLRSSIRIAPFPFLQSHLYTATQPALFLLDNDKELWLWQGWNIPESNLELFKTELELAKKTAVDYSKEKEKLKGHTIPIKHVLAGLEPVHFINIFPYWSKRDDITDIQTKEGHSRNVTIIGDI